jgi:uncharacterized protein
MKPDAGPLRFTVGGLRSREWRQGNIPSRHACLVEMVRPFPQTADVKVIRFLPLLLLAIFLSGCKKSGPAAVAPYPAQQTVPTHAQAKLPTIQLYLGAEVLDAEMALTPEQIQTGMMFRTNIQDGDAMLFDLRMPQRASFWMKNCPESISCAYISPDGVIQEIHHLEKNDTNAVIASVDNIRFVVETSEGWFTRHHVSTGMVVTTEKGPLADTFKWR